MSAADAEARVATEGVGQERRRFGGGINGISLAQCDGFAESAERTSPVFVLRSAFGGCHDRTGWKVAETDG